MGPHSTTASPRSHILQSGTASLAWRYEQVEQVVKENRSKKPDQDVPRNGIVRNVIEQYCKRFDHRLADFVERHGRTFVDGIVLELCLFDYGLSRIERVPVTPDSMRASEAARICQDIFFLGPPFWKAKPGRSKPLSFARSSN
jgi:hypothetical protein